MKRKLADTFAVNSGEHSTDAGGGTMTSLDDSSAKCVVSPMLKAALEYADKGLEIFPLNGKVPYKGTHGHLEATSSEPQIHKWWARWPTANIGLPTGRRNGFFVVDADGPAGERSLAALEKRFGPLPKTKEVRTGRGDGGRHLCFRHPGGKIKSGDAALGEKLDVKGDGGYVVAPPSIHPETKTRYVVVTNEVLAEAPAWLIELVRDGYPKKELNGRREERRKIHEGERNVRLTSLAGSMRRKNFSAAAILAALRIHNNEQCDPPLGEPDIEKIARSVSHYDPTPTAGAPWTDAANAARFARQHADEVRYCAEQGTWYAWDGRRWAADDATGAPMTSAKETARETYAEAAAEPDDARREKLGKWAVRSESRTALEAMLALARDEKPIRVRKFQEVFDHDPWLLNALNGTINLRTGELREHRHKDYITKLVPIVYDPAATCPLFDNFLLEVMENDTEMVTYLWRVIGYCLTGDTSERTIFLLYGEGLNGKTTFIECVANLLGEYAHCAPFKEFLHKPHDGASNEIAQFQGKRFVYSVEPPRGRGFDEAILKQLSGKDKVRARSLYVESVEWRPELKLFFAANHKPQIRETTDGIWDRVKLIEFPARFDGTKMDRKLSQKLDKELPGILAAAVRGSLDWQRRGLSPPEKVKTATSGYRNEMNDVGNFIEECCENNKDQKTPTGDLYVAYRNLAYAQGAKFPLGMKSFSQELHRLGYPSQKAGGIRCHRGLKLIHGQLDKRFEDEKPEL